MTTEQQVERAIIRAVLLLRARAPKKTGNLAYNAVNWKREGVNKWVIYVDEDIAPYMVYTNEPWLSEKWKGKQNPNEGWWENVINEVKTIIASELNGNIKEK